MKKCPYCAEEVQDEAVKCKHCHKTMTNVKTKADDSGSTPNKTQQRSLGAKVGNVIGILLFFGGLTLLSEPTSENAQNAFIMALFALSLTDYYLPLIRHRVSEKTLHRVRVFLPFVIFFGGPTLVAIINVLKS